MMLMMRQTTIARSKKGLVTMVWSQRFSQRQQPQQFHVRRSLAQAEQHGQHDASRKESQDGCWVTTGF